MLLQTPVDEYYWVEQYTYFREYVWIAPYIFSIVLLGMLAFGLYLFEHAYASHYGKPFLRNYFVYRKLKKEQKSVLRNNFSFYDKLSAKHKRQFEHRVSYFLKTKNFVGRSGLEVTEFMRVIIAAVGCMVSFGRKNYSYNLVSTIIIYPDEFLSTVNNLYYKGEFNPKHKVLAFSWKDFMEGYEINNNNINLGIHEFMHAMQVEAKNGKDPDSDRFLKQFQNILKLLSQPHIKEKLKETGFFRSYAFTNEYEFMAVLAEYFFESPTEFKQHFPGLYGLTKKMLNFDFAGY